MLLLPYLRSKDPLLIWSMEACIDAGIYFLNKVSRGFHDTAEIILYFVWIFWWDMNTVKQFLYLEVSISQFEKTPVKYCWHWYWRILMFSLSLKSVKILHLGLFSIHALMMLALEPLWFLCIRSHRYISMAF